MPTVKHLIHLDSYKNRYNNEYYDCQFNLDKPYYNVKKCKLLSLELPIGFCNIHEGINEFKIYIEGVFYSFFIPVGTYNNIEAIVTAIDAQIPKTFKAETPPFANFWDVVIYISENDKKIYISAGPNLEHYYASTDWYIVDNPLSNLILGIFSTNAKILGGSFIKNDGRTNINIDNYVSMHIWELGSNNNDSRITYKIPLPLTLYNVLFYTTHIFYPQEIYRDISTLTTLNIKFHDRFNNPLISNGYSWSGTLELTCEE